MDWIEEWKKRDPYFQDIEGFQKFIEQKERELHVQASVTLDTGYTSQGYLIYLEIPYADVPDEYRTHPDTKEEQQIENMINELRKLLLAQDFNRIDSPIGLRPGATSIFKDIEGKWKYFGDYSHCGEEDIDLNAQIMWKIWKVIGSQIKGCYGVHKDYQCESLYFCQEEGAEKVKLPPFSVYPWSRDRIIGDATSWGESIKLLIVEEPTEAIWSQIEVLVNALLSANIPNRTDPFEKGFIWTLPENEPLPVLALHRKTIPDVMNTLAKGGGIYWDPENSIDIMRNGGLEILHPFLRKSYTLAWNPDEVFWDEEAEWMRKTYYQKFDRAELQQHKVAELIKICRAKNLNVVHRKNDMIDAILEANFNIVEEVTPEEDVFDYQSLF